MIKNSFTLRVLVINFIVLALPLLIDSFIFFQRSYHESIKQAEMKIQQMANFRTTALSQVVPLSQTLLKEFEFFLQRDRSLRQFNQEEINLKLAAAAYSGANFQLFILKQENEDTFRMYASSLPRFYNKVYQDLTLSRLLEKKDEGTFIRYHFRPIFDAFNLFLTVARRFGDEILMATLDIEEEIQTIIEEVTNGERIDFAFLNSDGIVFASTLPTLEGHYFDYLSEQKRNEIINSDLLGNIKLASQPLSLTRGEDPLFFEFLYDNQIQIAYRSFIPEIGASIVAFSSKEVLFGRAIKRFLVLYLMFGLILVIGGIAAYWLSLWISRPLRQLSHSMEKVSKGNLSVRFKEEPLGFEINILGRIFNQTLDTLLEHMQRAENERVKKETYQKEIAVARSVQQNLLPQETPYIEGAEIAGAYVPAKEVGGDFYGFFTKKTKEGEAALFFGVTDAAGKGLSSAIYALSFRSLLIAYSSLYDDVGETLSHTNNAFLEEVSDSGMFLSALHGTFRPKWKMLSYYSCGNIPGIVRRANGHLVILEHSGMAIGLKPSSRYVPDHIQLYAGDLVIFFTEGLIEAVNAKNQKFSLRQLKNLLQNKNWKTAQEVVSGIIQELQEFTGGTEQQQEATLVALKIKEDA